MLRSSFACEKQVGLSPQEEGSVQDKLMTRKGRRKVMHMIGATRLVMLVLFSGMTFLSSLGSAHAENASQAGNLKWTSGGTEQGKWMFGFRAGFAPLTQELRRNFSTEVGSLVNVQGMYSLNKWLLAGLTLEWERHSVNQERPSVDLGHVDTVSLLPTVEVRPGRLGSIGPYASMGLGVNVNSFGESNALRGTTISPSNNVAWRLAWGADYFLTSALALNAEMAYKRNDGHVTINGVQSSDWNASSFGFLFGVRALF
jgi:outer membrane protein